MFKDIEETRKFMEAGNATITLKSVMSGKHITFRVRRTRDNGPIYFVSLLTGPDNERSYSYIGIYNKEKTEFRLTSKSKMREESEPVQAFRFFLKCIQKNQIPNSLEIFHEGRCGRCNRKLTTPESVASGFGPECIQYVGD